MVEMSSDLTTRCSTSAAALSAQEAGTGNSAATLVGFAEAQRMTSLSRSTVERLIRVGDFPEPVTITPARRGFVRAEVERWILERIARRPGKGQTAHAA